MSTETNEQQEPIEIEGENEKKRKRGPFSVFLLSTIIHSILILLTILVVMSTNQKPKEDIIIASQIAEQLEDEVDPEVQRDVVKEKVEVTVETVVETQVTVTMEETTDHNETDNNMEMATAEGTTDAISDSPQVGSGLMGNIGGGGGGGGTFGTRSGGGKKKALLRGGGSAKTESAVDAALRWLMRHQEKDGRWNREKYGNDNDNSGFKRSQTEPHAALTGLATLAFLSAGHTPKIGKFKNTVKNALDWILSIQKPDGSFGYTQEYSVYCNAICTLTLAEAYAMHPDSKLKVSAQKALDHLATFSKTTGFHKIVDGKPNSVSVAGWMMMAFKSAKIAGLNVPEDVFKKYRERLDEMTEKDASGNPIRVHYITKGDRNDSNTTMTCVGMLIYQYLGMPRGELSVMADKILKDLPVWGTYSMNNDLYKWYYATLAMFQFGGEQWKKWNSVMSKMLVDNQRKGGPLDGSLQDIDGSWDFEGDFWGRNLGRTYTTAMAAFCLEVYYRYETVGR